MKYYVSTIQNPSYCASEKCKESGLHLLFKTANQWTIKTDTCQSFQINSKKKNKPIKQNKNK